MGIGNELGGSESASSTPLRGRAHEGSTGADAADGQPDVGALPLAERLVRTLCIVGLVLAVAQIVPLARLFLTPSPTSRFDDFSLRSPYGWSLLAWVLTDGIAPLLLIAGAAGGLTRRRWARGLLFSYALVWIVGTVLSAGTLLSMSISDDGPGGGYPPTVLLMRVAHDCVVGAFPTMLVICLSWPETRRAHDQSRSSFPVLPVVHPLPSK